MDLKKGLHVISGHVRSGKSRWAEHLLRNSKSVTYVATMIANPADPMLTTRIKLHKQRRPIDWNLIESKGELLSEINNLPPNESILIDSLGGYVTANLNLSSTEWEFKTQSLIKSMTTHKGTIIVVVEEVGWGLVAPTQVGNIFCDRIGTLSEQLLQIANSSWLVLHGRAIDLESISIRIP